MTETTVGHDERGRFAVGNSGGPGRPRRAIEREYLRVLSDAVSLDDWREVVARAVESAKAGDDKSRDWLAKYVIGDAPIGLTELLARELLDIDVDLEAQVKVAELSKPTPSILGSGWIDPDQSFYERAGSIKAQAARAEAEATEAEAKRAKREARKAADVGSAA